MSNNPLNEDEEDYFLPPEFQRPFTSGVRRKPVPFVRSSDLTTTTSQSPRQSGPNIANKYLSIVLKQSSEPPAPPPSLSEPDSEPVDKAKTHSAPSSPAPKCEVCDLPIDGDESATVPDISGHRPHEASLAHQVCLAHSHPPSALDRTRQGMRYLAAYGWDPDRR
ncbi:hypothetical protein BBP40_010645, partial [Aspergillus hancockii]